MRYSGFLAVPSDPSLALVLVRPCTGHLAWPTTDRRSALELRESCIQRFTSRSSCSDRPANSSSSSSIWQRFSISSTVSPAADTISAS
eukprot:scaffold167_cov347-Prasinococcus_capsulatus_cf.AAC.9